MSMYPNQASAVLTPCATSTDASVGFGFTASRVHVTNDRAAAVYVNLASTAISTGGYKTCSGETLVVDGIACGGVGVASTTTSMGTFVRVLALGG